MSDRPLTPAEIVKAARADVRRAGGAGQEGGLPPREPVPCTTCGQPIVPPELPSLSWESHARQPDGSRGDPTHVEHWRCYLKRVPRTWPRRSTD